MTKNKMNEKKKLWIRWKKLLEKYVKNEVNIHNFDSVFIGNRVDDFFFVETGKIQQYNWEQELEGTSSVWLKRESSI